MAKTILNTSIKQWANMNIEDFEMNIPPNSNKTVYLNKIQNQVYNKSKLEKLFRLWTAQLKSGKINQDVFDRLCETHFENLVELPKYEYIEGKRHSTECSHATGICKCWCKGAYHGKKIMQENVI